MMLLSDEIIDLIMMEVMEMGVNEGTNVTTGEVRLSFVHVFKPYAYEQGQEEKFSVTCILPKSDTKTKARIDSAIQEAIRIGKEKKWNGVAPPNIPSPIWDGDGVKQDGTAFGPECKGCWIFTASAKADYPPEVVDSARNAILAQSEVYSGCYGKVNVNFFPYMFGGKKGIGCGLGPVMKTRDGEPLSTARVSAADAFAADDDLI